MSILFHKEQSYLPLFQRVSSETGVPVALLLAHARQESNFDPSAYRSEPAINDASYGIVQVLLKTAQGIDPNATAAALFDPYYNLSIGARYIAQNLAKYPNSIQDSIAAYNSGVPRKNDAGQYVNSRGVPNVQNYVDKVYTNYVDYSKWLDNGAQTIDLSINPWLVAGFSFLFVLTVVGGVTYARRRVQRKQLR